MKGFRVPAQASKKEQLKGIDVEVKNIQQATRISQMMLRQMMENMQAMSSDISNTMNQLLELQYKFVAIKESLNLDADTLDAIANKYRLQDFEEASERADVKDQLEVAESVGEDSTVVITSNARDNSGKDKGIFRSRIKLSECGVPALITGLSGKKVGEKVVVKLNEMDHEVELLAIRDPKKELSQTSEQPNSEVAH
jgi:hypothetical protein